MTTWISTGYEINSSKHCKQTSKRGLKYAHFCHTKLLVFKQYITYSSAEPGWKKNIHVAH